MAVAHKTKKQDIAFEEALGRKIPSMNQEIKEKLNIHSKYNKRTIDLVALSDAWRRGADFGQAHKYAKELVDASRLICISLTHVGSKNDGYGDVLNASSNIVKRLQKILDVARELRIYRVILPVANDHPSGKDLLTILMKQKTLPGYPDIHVELYKTKYNQKEMVNRHGKIDRRRNSALDQGNCFVHIANRGDYALC